jgi:hypothetical protein
MMEIKPTSLPRQEPMPRQEDQEEQGECIQDVVTFTARDLSPQGKLILIIQPAEKKEDRCDLLKDTCQKCGLGEFKDELEVINGFTYEIDPQHLEKFLKMLPKDVSITVDHPVSFFPAMPKRPKK